MWPVGVQSSGPECLLCFSMGYCCTRIYADGLFSPSPKVSKSRDNCFLNHLIVFNWGMQQSKCRPPKLLSHAHSDWFKPPRHMLTFLVVYSSINCSAGQWLWIDLNWRPLLVQIKHSYITFQGDWELDCEELTERWTFLQQQQLLLLLLLLRASQQPSN